MEQPTILKKLAHAPSVKNINEILKQNKHSSTVWAHSLYGFFKKSNLTQTKTLLTQQIQALIQYCVDHAKDAAFIENTAQAICELDNIPSKTQHVRFINVLIEVLCGLEFKNEARQSMLNLFNQAFYEKSGEFEQTLQRTSPLQTMPYETLKKIQNLSQTHYIQSLFDNPAFWQTKFKSEYSHIKLVEFSCKDFIIAKEFLKCGLSHLDGHIELSTEQVNNPDSTAKIDELALKVAITLAKLYFHGDTESGIQYALLWKKAYAKNCVSNKLFPVNPLGAELILDLIEAEHGLSTELTTLHTEICEHNKSNDPAKRRINEFTNTLGVVAERIAVGKLLGNNDITSLLTISNVLK